MEEALVRLRRRAAPGGVWWLGAAALVLAVAVAARALDPEAVARTWSAAVGSPAAVAAAIAAYALAFALRAVVWTRVLPGLSFGHALAALHVSLAGNHALPLRLGEVLRVTTVVRRARIPVTDAAASTVALRAADVVAVAGLAAVLAPQLAGDVLGAALPALVAAAAGAWATGLWWLRRLARRRESALRARPLLVAGAAVAAWALESAVVYVAAGWAGLELGVREAVLVTAVTVAAQTLAVAPGGFGTYEGAAVAVLVALGHDAGPALAAALAAHALKTLYALAAGGVALFLPAPALVGRLRLPRPRAPVAAGPAPPEDAPVLLFLPAHDEEASVGAVVRRVPGSVCGRAVVCLVVDDGSRDRTAERAAAAGAAVVSSLENRGLGAAVRRGLAAGVARGAAAIAFCDADGEYAPEELERLVAPILAGEADYVVGSRFAGGPPRMRRHRRLGNVVLTRLLAFVARVPLTDGQSGYRALSPGAAAEAEVIHDFNYAQVLTLDLLAKAYRYAEVPISYRFRETGSSFVRLGPYLRHVVPAVHRELNVDAH